jgi:DNA polymerase-3 subunit alpha
VDIGPKSVNEKLISQIEGILVDNPGKCSFKVNIVDEQENIAVDLLSRKFMVNPNDDLLNSFNNIAEVELKVST